MLDKAAAIAIAGRWKEEVADPEVLPTAYDNATFDPEEHVGALWARMSVLIGQGNVVSFGATKRFRTTGIMAVQVFYPLDEGDAAQLDLVDLIKQKFRAVTVSGVRFRVPSSTRVGKDVSGNWHQINVSCPFYFDHIA